MVFGEVAGWGLSGKGTCFRETPREVMSCQLSWEVIFGMVLGLACLCSLRLTSVTLKETLVSRSNAPTP
jgi:hypothetical protein